MAEKGHNPTVEEPDIRRAFKVDSRTEKFDLKLADLSAHTLRIIEIIEDETANLKQKKRRELENKINNG